MMGSMDWKKEHHNELKGAALQAVRYSSAFCGRLLAMRQRDAKKVGGGSSV